MAKVYPEKRQGNVIGYVADLGKQPNGKRLKKFFKTVAEAEVFIGSHKKEPLDAGFLHDHKNEFLHSYERCKEMGVSLNDVVEFYSKHGARKGNPAIQAVIDSLLAGMERAGRKPTYIVSISKHMSKFTDYVGKDTLIGDVTEQKVTNFVFKKHEHVAAVTKMNLIRNLSVLFNYAIKKNFIGFNPVSKVDKPSVKFEVPKVLTPEDFATLLNRCLKRKWDGRLTVFILVGFCGIRTQEACQLTWSDIDLDNCKVMVPARVAKKGSFRRNVIPENAMKWLRLIRDDRRKGAIIGNNSVALLRSAVKYAHISHTKNCLRHSFCSYALENGMPLADVVAMMGHNGSPAMINSHYRNIVEQRAAKKWWAIAPSQSVA